MRARWWLAGGSVLGAVAACVGEDPAASPNGGTTGSSSGASDGGPSASSSSTSAGGTSSSGAPDASSCDGVFCDGFENQLTFDGWSVVINDSQAVAVAGVAEGTALGAQLGAVDRNGDNRLSALIQRTVSLPAGRFVRLDLQFWVSKCGHPIYEIVRFQPEAQPIDLSWSGTEVNVRFYSSMNPAIPAELIEFPAIVLEAWTPFWVEVDRETGAVRAAIANTEKAGTKSTPLQVDAGAQLQADLSLGAAATVAGCETRIDNVKITVHD